MRTRAPLWMAAAAASAVAVVLVLNRTPDAPPAAPRAEADLFPFVRSFTGTQPDGAVEAAADSGNVANGELVRLFDYYLAAQGERGLPEIRAEIERELDRRLAPALAAEGRRLLARYLDYKHALVDVERQMQGAAPEARSPRARFEAMQEARRRFFNEREIAAMFGADDAYDQDALARLEIQQDARLTPPEKQARLAGLTAAMPPAVREAKEAPFAIARLEQQARVMRAQGASDDEVYRMRAAALSPEAAARMAQVDREEQAWQARIAAFQTERGALLAQGLPPDQLQGALAQLRSSRFTPEEQPRLRAYVSDDQ